MRLEPSEVNPLAEFLDSLIKHEDEWILLTSNNIPIIALYFNSGGVICETQEEVINTLKLLAEYEVIEVNENKLRITQHGKDALKASKRPLRSLQNLQKNGSKSKA